MPALDPNTPDQNTPDPNTPVFTRPLRYGQKPDRRIPPDCVYVSLEVQDRAHRFVRTGGYLYPRFDEPWHAWPLGEQIALERAARADLLLTLPPAAAALVRRGRCHKLVLLKMRQLHGPVPPSPTRQFDVAQFRPPPPAPPPPPLRRNTDPDTWDIL